MVDDLDELQRTVEDTLEALVGHGDLLELTDTSQEESSGCKALLYLAPPAFVRRQSGAVVILGILPDDVSLLPDEVVECVEYINHIRVLPPNAGTKFADQLGELGWIELSSSAWLKAPKAEAAAEYLGRMNRLLDAAPVGGDVPGLVLLDPGRSVRYYRGRWVESTTHTGRFVGRRAQAYGADLWCYVKVKDGNPIRFVDLPLKSNTWRGCDEAWRIQAAIDYEQGTPQIFRVRPGPNGTEVVDFFSPLPMWVRRKWNVVGVPILSSGCLFSYRLRENEIDEEVRFLKEYAWLTEIS
ncbi:MAG: hypothetical protein E3J72_00910 [Planctomycetota bacterium]|nr:MAG: hypothetical protein E3J72_00910 [Planctomycetota bacterium]